MRRLAAIVALAGLVIACGNTAAQSTPLIPCYGAAADYVAAYDNVDGTVDGAVSYPEARVFLEVQSHLQPPGETERHHFEHIHLGMCFPYAETWVQPAAQRTVNVRYVFHNVSNYNISAAKADFVDANNSGGGYNATAAQKAELEAAMDASAGTTKTVFQSYTMANIGTSCRKTFRPTLNTVRANAAALVDEWFAAAQWTTYIAYAGQPTCNPEFQRDQIRSRSWILPSGGYLYNTPVGLPTASQMNVPYEEAIDFVWAGSNSGSDPLAWYIDPDFHAHPENLGIAHQDLGVMPRGDVPVSVPLEGVPPGQHRLVLVTVRGIQSSIVVLPFKKAGVECN